MADAPAAEATKKAKKKDEGGEKKEKLIIQGRKDEDILGSAYVKKFKLDDPTDWSRYADDPRGMLNRRRLTREERRRQFTVTNVVGDPRETAPRIFDALFEETDQRLQRPKTKLEAVRLRVLRVCAGRWWDRMYLFNLGWALVLLPAAMEDDFGLGCAAGPYHRRGQDGRIWHLDGTPGSADPKQCQVLWPPLLFMVFCTVPPILGALCLRLTSFAYLKSMRDERRWWSAFFVLCLKCLAQRPSVPTEFSEQFTSLYERLRHGSQAKVAPEEVESPSKAAQSPEKALALVENDDDDEESKSAFQRQQEEVRKSLASLGTILDEKVSWRCVACGRDNTQPLILKHDKKCDLMIHRRKRKSTDGDTIRASFRTSRYKPSCSLCSTPIDYKVRPSNKAAFNAPSGDALNAFTLIIAARETRDAEVEEARLRALRKQRDMERKVAVAQGKLGKAGSSSTVMAKMKLGGMFSSGMFSASAITNDEETVDSATIESRVGTMIERSSMPSMDEKDEDDAAAYVRRMMEAQATINNRLGPCRSCLSSIGKAWTSIKDAFSPQVKNQDGMLFNDWSFKQKVKKFKPVPDRRVLENGERYMVGDEVESFEHMPTWYPATVTKYNSNGSYVIRFHNGEEADAVSRAKIRYRIQPPITGLQQIVAGSFLVFLVVQPAWLCLYAANPLLNTGDWWDAIAFVLLLPVLVLSLTHVVAILLQMVLLYLKDGKEAGPCLLIKIACFYVSAPLFLLIFCCIALSGGNDGLFLAALILSFLGFLLSIMNVAATVKPMYAYLTMVGAAPLLVFLILFSLWCAHNPNGAWVGTQDDDSTGPLGILHGRREGNKNGAPPLLLEGYLYVMFLPVFGTYYLCWWLFHNLPHLWDANFAPPDDWRAEARRKKLRGRKRWTQSRARNPLEAALFGGLPGLRGAEEAKAAPLEAEAPPPDVAIVVAGDSGDEAPAAAPVPPEAAGGEPVEEAPAGDAVVSGDEEAPADDEPAAA